MDRPPEFNSNNTQSTQQLLTKYQQNFIQTNTHTPHIAIQYLHHRLPCEHLHQQECCYGVYVRWHVQALSSGAAVVLQQHRRVPGLRAGCMDGCLVDSDE